MVFLLFQRDCLGPARLGQVGCINRREYQEEMKWDCSRVGSFLCMEAHRSRHCNTLGDLWPPVWQVSVFDALNPYSFLIAQKLAGTHTMSHDSIWEKQTLYIPILSPGSCSILSSRSSSSLPELQLLLIHKAARVKARNI